MSLAVYEWRKLFRLPALWAFLALSLLFNALLICTLSEWDRAFFNDTSADAALLGQRVDQAFCNGLSALPETENRTVLLQSVTGLENIFETYDTGILKEFYTDVVENSQAAVSWMAWKYDTLSSRVDHLARTDAGMDVYAGPVTQGSHQFLFGTLMRSILLRNSRYNQHATTGSLLVEVGAAGNSPEEAALAGRLFAERMVEVLQSRSK